MWGYNTVRPAGLRVGDDRCLFLNSTALISLNKEIFIYLISSILISRRIKILLFLSRIHARVNYGKSGVF